MKYLIKKLPPQILSKVLKKKFKVPDLAFSEDFTVKLARSRDELEEAYSLLHDCYVGQGLMSPEPSGLRCTLFSLLPETATVVVKHKDKTVGTASLIKDSRMGLPSDKDYLMQNDQLRMSGKRLIEVSSLAVSKEFRSKGHAVSLLLMKYIYHYSLMMGGDNLVITIHPRAEVFYEALMAFKREGPVVSYDFVDGALAIYMNVSISSKKVLTELGASFQNNNFKRNMALWFVSYMDERFEFPKFAKGQVVAPVLTPELIEYFYVTKTNQINKFNTNEKRVFFEMLVHFFGEQEISRFKEFYEGFQLREYRVTVDIPASVEITGQFFIFKIIDLSPSGAYFSPPKDLELNIHKGQLISVRFQLGNQSFELKGQVMWSKNVSILKNATGFEVRFESTSHALKNKLRTLDSFEDIEKAA
ncbi:MAG: hypothetical protein CME64_13965 [Halobacteriovoraceae bacterium]|nr:hypothetical protein [Halobacteriovoraceae bacterium]